MDNKKLYRAVSAAEGGGKARVLIQRPGEALPVWVADTDTLETAEMISAALNLQIAVWKRHADRFDIVGYCDTGGQMFCDRCVPARYRRECYELHRFEAEGECEHCGTVLASSPKLVLEGR